MEAVEVNSSARALLVNRAQAFGVPLGVHIDVTYRCDLDCVHCYLADRDKEDLSFDEYVRLFAELKELGTLFVLISGGEIFHRKDGLDIIREARRNRFEVRLITHGGHITEDVARELSEIGIAAVGMSIYAADAATHDAVTKVPGSWERTVQAARNLRAHGVTVLLKCVLMNVNQGVVDEMKALARSVDSAIEFGFEIKGDNKGSDALMGLNMELGDRIAVAGCVYPELIDMESLPWFSPDKHTCLAGNASCYIGPDGTVQPCLEWYEDCGNIRERSFTEIWKTAPVFVRARTIRRKSFEGCSSCENFSHCSLCPAKAHRETGSPTGSAPSKCRETMAKVLSFEALRDQRTSPSAQPGTE